MNTTSPLDDITRQDIGYLLTAYADGQLAPEGVMWVEEQLDRNPDLRARLKEIRHLQAGLRTAFAGGAPEFVLDLPRREALLANAANPPRKKLRFPAPMWIGLAASVMAMVYVGMQLVAPLRQSGAYAMQDEAELSPMTVTTVTAAPAEAGEAQSYFYQGEGTVSRGQSHGGGDSLNRAEDRLRMADTDGGAVFGGQAGPELLAKGQRDAAPPHGVSERKLATAEAASRMRPSAPAAAAPPPPATPAPTGASLARTDRGGRPATKEFDGRSAAEPTAPPAPVVTLPPQARSQVQEYAKQSAPDALDQSRSMKPKSAPEQAAAADSYQRQNEARAYNGTLGPSLAKKADQAGVPADKNAAPAKPGAGRQTGKDKAVEQVPVALAEQVAADDARPINQLDVPIEEILTSDETRGREEAVASSETGATGAFLSIGAAGKKTAERRAVAKQESTDQQAPSAGQQLRKILAGDDVPEIANGPQGATGAKDYPKVFAEIRDTKSPEISRGVVASSRNNIQGQQDLVMLTIDQNQRVKEGTEFFIYRDQNYIVSARVEKVLGDMAACRILPDSWNTRGLQIQHGDRAASHFGDGIPAPKANPQVWLRSEAPFDAQQSLAALRAPVTVDGTMGVAQILRLIGGDKVGFEAVAIPVSVLERPVSTSLRDEPAARGILRVVRSAGLQAQFSGGVVKLDTATRPLDPADTQGFDLPTFKDLFGTSPMQVTAVDAIQTVAIDADTASYEYAKARVASGQPVDPTTIKPEHFINAMPMDYPAAQGPEAFTLYAEAAPSPFARAGTSWGPRTAVVSIGAVAKPAAADERKPLALTLAIDCSGSMAQAGGLDRIQRGLLAFVEHLRAEDRVSIVAFGDQARVVLPATPGNDRAALVNALVNLATGGATNAAEGLGLAYQLAAETAAVGVESRVLLATDGGTVAGADDLLRRVTAFKDRGITLVVVGTGQTYRAGPLQELATKGDGQHFYVGSDQDAETLFTGKLLPDRLAVLAKDAKLQVTWNPQRVSHARLIGYDQRRLAAKDFRDNTVDAGELSQDTQVTALFEVLLVDGGSGSLGTAAVRYKDMRRDQIRELACPLPGTILQSQASDRLRLLACAAATAEWLQRGWWSNVHLITPEEIRAKLARCPQAIANELRGMVK